MSKNATLKDPKRSSQKDHADTVSQGSPSPEEARPLRSVNEILEETLAQREGIFDDEDANPGLDGTGRLNAAPGDEDTSGADPRSSAFRTEDEGPVRRDEGNHGSEVSGRDDS